jgi:hypothetical protein
VTYPTAWTPEAIRLGYITPEDIGDAITACNGDHELLQMLAVEVLWALSDKRCEDASLCAFVMARALQPVPVRPWRERK